MKTGISSRNRHLLKPLCRIMKSGLMVLLTLFSVTTLALNLEVTLDSDTKTPGSFLYYRIVVSNTDGTTRQNVVVSANVPLDSTLIESSSLPAVTAASCSFSSCSPGETPSWNLGNIASGDSKIIIAPYMIDADAPDATSLVLNVSATHDGAASTNDDSVNATVISLPSAELTISSKYQVLGAGELIDYTVRYGNTGSTGMASSQVSATVPNGSIFVSASDGGAEVAGKVVWNTGVLNAGDAGTRYFSVRSSSSAVNGIIYTSDAELSNGAIVQIKSAESVVVHSNVDLTLNVTALVDQSQPGDLTYYRYVIGNKGSTDLTDVSLNLMMAERSNFLESGTLPLINNCSFSHCVSGEWGVYSIGQLSAGETRVLTVPVTRVTPRDGEPLVSHAILTEGSAAYSLGTKPTVIANDENFLELAITAEKQVVASGETHRYEMSFGNVDSTAYQNLQLEFVLPDGATFVEASDDGTNTDGVVSWDLNTLNAGEGGKRYLVIQAPTGLDNGEVLLSESALHTGGANLIQSGESVVIQSGVELTLNVTALMDQSQPGDLTYYRYVIGNKGSTDLTDVNLNLMMAERSNFLESGTLPLINNCSFSHCDNGEWGVYSIGQLSAGETRVLTVPVTRVTPRDGEPLVSHAILTEGSAAYSLGTKPTVIANDENFLELAITAEKQVVASGETHRYEVSYGNVDSTAYQNLQLEFVLPDGATFVEASDDGTNTDGVVSWDLSTLNAGEGGKRYLVVQAPAGLDNGEVLLSEAALHTGGANLIQSGESVVIRSGVELTLNVTALADQSQPGDLTYYRYVIGNKGSTDLTDVNLNLMMAERSNFLESATLPLINNCSFSHCDSGEWGVYSIGQLSAGETRVLTVPVARVTPRDGEPLVSHAILTEGSAAYSLGTKPTVIANDENFLKLVVAASNQVIGPNERYRYELSYGNVDSTAYQNLQLDLVLPNGAIFVEASDGGANTNGVVSWNLNTLNIGEGGKRVVVLDSPASSVDGTILVAEASLNGGGESWIQSSETVVVKSAVDLTLDVGVIGDLSQPGNLVYQRYIVANTGATDLADVELNIMMGERSNFLESSSLPVINNCAFSHCDSGEWALLEIGQLNAGDSRTLILPVARISPLDGEPIVSQAILTEGSGAYTLGKKTVVINSNETKVRLTIESENYLVKPNSQQKFDLVVGNPTASAISNSLLVVEIPDTYFFTSATGSYEKVANKIYWPLGNLAANQWRRESVTLLLAQGAVNAEIHRVRALVENDSSLISIARADTSTITELESGISLQVEGLVPNEIGSGSDLTLTMTIENESVNQVADVALSLMVPENTSAAEAGTEITNCSFSSCESGEWATWTLGSMDSDDVQTKQLTANVLAPTDGEVLVLNTFLSDSSSPHDDILLTRAWGVGVEFSVDTNHDSDADGIPDWWELRWGYNRLDASDALTDDDADGSDNLEEYQENTDPTDEDTDNDGILDGPDNNSDFSCNAGPDQTVNEFTASVLTNVVLDGSASSILSGSIDNYLWTQEAGNSVVLVNANTVSSNFDVFEVEASGDSVTLKLTCTSDLGVELNDNVTVNIANVNRAPLANAGNAQQVVEGENVNLDGSLSADPDGDAISYLWVLESATQSGGVDLSSSTVAAPMFVAPDNDDASVATYTFSLTVSDSILSSTSSVVISVIGSDALPIANAGIDQSVNEGVVVTLNGGNSSDAEGEITYLWNQIEGAPVSLSDAAQAQLTFTAPSVTSGSISLIFELTVTDSASNSVTDQVVITVRAVTDNGGGDNGGGSSSGGGGSLFTLLGFMLLLLTFGRRK